MDNNIEDYLRERFSHQQQDEEAITNIYYERNISVYRSSTVMVQRSWGTTFIECGKVLHYEEFIQEEI